MIFFLRKMNFFAGNIWRYKIMALSLHPILMMIDEKYRAIGMLCFLLCACSVISYAQSFSRASQRSLEDYTLVGYSTSPYQAPRSASFNSTSRMAATTSGNLRPMSMTSMSTGSSLSSQMEYGPMAAAPMAAAPGIMPLADDWTGSVTVWYPEQGEPGAQSATVYYKITTDLNLLIVKWTSIEYSNGESERWQASWGATNIENRAKEHATQIATEIAKDLYIAFPIGDVLPLLLFALLFAAYVAWKKKNDVTDVV